MRAHRARTKGLQAATHARERRSEPAGAAKIASPQVPTHRGRARTGDFGLRRRKPGVASQSAAQEQSPRPTGQPISRSKRADTVVKRGPCAPRPGGLESFHREQRARQDSNTPANRPFLGVRGCTEGGTHGASPAIPDTAGRRSAPANESSATLLGMSARSTSSVRDNDV